MGPQAQELGDQATFLSLCTFCQGLALLFFKLQLVTSQSFFTLGRSMIRSTLLSRVSFCQWPSFVKDHQLLANGFAFCQGKQIPD
jgi:hypothetical protein